MLCGQSEKEAELARQTNVVDELTARIEALRPLEGRLDETVDALGASRDEVRTLRHDLSVAEQQSEDLQRQLHTALQEVGLAEQRLHSVEAELESAKSERDDALATRDDRSDDEVRQIEDHGR